MIELPGTAIPSSSTGVITPESIERTLRQLWNSLEDTEHTIQVRTLNLLVYIAEPPDAETYQRISSVAVQNPGRTITLQPEPGPPHAEASISCRLGDRRGCGEQIVLRGGGTGERLHSLALALLQPGLPAALWWQGTPPFKRRPFVALADAVNHVLVDSRTWHDPLQYLPILAEIRRRRAETLLVSDLQWVSLTPWRQLIAEAFDPVPNRALLNLTERVVIDYGNDQHLVGALLLAGWLMSRLGWEVGSGEASKAGDELQVSLAAPDRSISLTLRKHEEHNGIGGIELHGGGDTPASFICHEQRDALCVSTRVSLPPMPAVERITNLRRPNTPALISEELSVRTMDMPYTAALDAAITVAKHIGALL